MSKGSNRRKEDKSKVDGNWPYPDPFERKQAERRKREQEARKSAQESFDKVVQCEQD